MPPTLRIPLRIRDPHSFTLPLLFPVQMESLSHQIDPVVCLFTAAIYLVCFFVLSPLLVNSSTTARNYLRKTTQHQLLGHFVYSIVTSCFTVHVIMSGNVIKEAKSMLGFMTVEISFSYFITDIGTTLFILRNTISGEKMDLLHHITGSVGLLVGLYCQGASLALCILRLFSQLSTPFLVIRLWLRANEMNDTGVYLANFTVMIVTFFVSRIVIIPWSWRLYVYWVLGPESSLLPCAISGLVFVILDLLNVYWLCGMIWRFVEKVKMMGEKKHIPMTKM